MPVSVSGLVVDFDVGAEADSRPSSSPPFWINHSISQSNRQAGRKILPWICIKYVKAMTEADVNLFSIDEIQPD